MKQKSPSTGDKRPQAALEAELGRKEPSRASWGCLGVYTAPTRWGGGHRVGSRPAGEQGWSRAGRPQVVEVALLSVRAPKGDGLTSWSPPRPFAQPLGMICFRGLSAGGPGDSATRVHPLLDEEMLSGTGTWGQWGPGLPRSQGRCPTRARAPEMSPRSTRGGCVSCSAVPSPDRV